MPCVARNNLALEANCFLELLKVVHVSDDIW